jgi:hypothetical protein
MENSQHNLKLISELAKLTPYSAEYLSLRARQGKIYAEKMNGLWYSTEASVGEYITKQAAISNGKYGELKNFYAQHRDMDKPLNYTAEGVAEKLPILTKAETVGHQGYKIPRLNLKGAQGLTLESLAPRFMRAVSFIAVALIIFYATQNADVAFAELSKVKNLATESGRYVSVTAQKIILSGHPMSDKISTTVKNVKQESADILFAVAGAVTTNADVVGRSAVNVLAVIELPQIRAPKIFAPLVHVGDAVSTAVYGAGDLVVEKAEDLLTAEQKFTDSVWNFTDNEKVKIFAVGDDIYNYAVGNISAIAQLVGRPTSDKTEIRPYAWVADFYATEHFSFLATRIYAIPESIPTPRYVIGRPTSDKGIFPADFITHPTSQPTLRESNKPSPQPTLREFKVGWARAQLAATAEISLGIVGRITESLRVAYVNAVNRLAEIFFGGSNSNYVINQKEDVARDEPAIQPRTAIKTATAGSSLSISELADIKQFIISELAGKGLTSNSVTVERIVSGLTQQELDMGLNVLNNKMLAQVADLKNLIAARYTSNFQAIALTNKIDTLRGTSLIGVSVNGISGLTDADIPDGVTASNYLPLAGGTITGNLTVNGFINTNGTTGGYKIDGNLILQASSTNFSTLVGQSAGAALLADGLYSTALGYQALMTATSSIYNTAVGYQALYSNTTGGDNTANGTSALYSNTTGYYNTANGTDALSFNTTGSYNAANGVNALSRNTTGNFNTANGVLALYYNRSATNTVAVGYTAGRGPASYYNQGGTYLGYASGYSAGTGSDYNTMLGYQSGYGVTTGANNILLGYNAGYSGTNLTTGSNNIIIGNDIGATSTTMTRGLNIGNLIFGTGLNGSGTTLSSGNVGIGTTSPYAKLSVVGQTVAEYFTATSTTNKSLFTGGVDTSGTTGGYSIDNNLILQASSTNFSTLVGRSAGAALLSNGLYSTALGYQALMTATSSDYNTAVGYRALYLNTTGYYNTANGAEALFSNTTGHDNTANGMDALYLNTTGNQNTANGANALSSNTTGYDNTANGANALSSNTTGYENTANGVDALTYNTIGTDNTANGMYALLANTTGSYNTANGMRALYYNNSATNTVAVGYAAGRGITSYNNQGGVYLGYQSGYSAGTGSDYNTMVGYQSGYGVTTGANNILLGYNAGYSGTNLTTGSNNIIIGNDIGATSTTMTRGLNIGNLIFGTGLDGSGTTLSTGNVGIGTTSPYARLSVVGQTVAEYFTATSTVNKSLFTGGVNTSGTTGGYSIDNNLILQASSTNFSTLVGRSAGAALNGTGAYNTALGYQALMTATSSTQNTAIGALALKVNTTGNYNVAIGTSALVSNTTGTYNTAVGLGALQSNTTGTTNNAQGFLALGLTTTGGNNTGQGYYALEANTIGSGNVGIGIQAGWGGVGIADQNSVIDTSSTFIGSAASRSESVASTTALTYATAIGANAKVGASNSMVLGGTGAYGVKVGIGTTSPLARLSIHAEDGNVKPYLFIIASSTASATTTLFSVGNAGKIFAPSITTNITGNGVCVTTTGEITNAGASACIASALKFKDNVQDLPADLAKNIVLNIKPVTYTDKEVKAENNNHFGFIADWSASLDKRLVDFKDGDFWSFEYMNYTAVLTKFVQDFYGEFQQLLARVTGLENKLNNQQMQIDELRAILATINGVSSPSIIPPPYLVVQPPLSGPTTSLVEIIVNGNNPALLNIGDVYGDLGAIASTTDASIMALGVRAFQNGVEVAVPQIDTATAGTYEIVYKIVDGSGAVLAEATRSVIVY